MTTPDNTPGRRPVLLAVDGNSLLHRSFHALEKSNLRTRDGRPTWAVKGFCSQMLGALERTGAQALVVGFDDHGNNIRKQRWPHYKATRSPKPPELGQQIALAIQLLRDAGIHVVVPEGLEADDVLASAARTAAAAGWDTVIVTSDRDSFALVNDTTSVLRIINGGVDASPLLTAERIITQLEGVRGDQYHEYAALRGDPSDNLAGMPGFGKVTARKLLMEFGTVQAAFDDIDQDGGQRVAAALGKACVTKLSKPENRAAYAETSQIMTMRTDVDLSLSLADGGAGCLPIPVGPLTAALDGLELASVRNLAVRLLTGAPVRPQAAAATMPDTAPWPVTPPDYDSPADDRPRRQLAAAAATPAAMAGSTAARPTRWDDTLF